MPMDFTVPSAARFPEKLGEKFGSNWKKLSLFVNLTFLKVPELRFN
jgi:hypothetical protein